MKILDGNAFKLCITCEQLVEEYRAATNMSQVDNLMVAFNRRGRILQTSYVDNVGRIMASNSGNLALGVYGVELTGYYNGEPWRFYASEVFEIVNEGGDSASSVVDGIPIYNVTFAVTLGDGADISFVDTAIINHNGSDTSHSDIRQNITQLQEDVANAGKVDDVKVNGVSVVSSKEANISIPTKVSDLQNDSEFVTENEMEAALEETGKVDDVKVNGSSVVYNKEANITIPTKTSDLQNDSNFATQSDLPTDLADLQDDSTHRTVTDVEKDIWSAKQNAITQFRATVDGDTGTPSADLIVENGEMLLALHDIKGEKGDDGNEGPQGPEGPQGQSAVFDPNTGNILATLEQTLGQSTVNAMSQKAVTKIIEGEDIVTNVPQEVTTGGKYYNLSLSAIGDPKTSAGYACAKVKVNFEGEQFIIAGTSGSNNAMRNYAWVSGTNGTSPISFGTQNANTRTNPLTVTAPANATYLLVNFKSYDAEQDYVKRVVVTHNNGINDVLENTVKVTEQTLNAAQKTQALTNLGINDLAENVARLTPSLSEIIYHDTTALTQGYSNIVIPIPGDGVYRVTTWCTTNAANTSKARMFYRKSSTSTADNIYASKDIPQGVPFTLAWTRREDYDTLQITMTGSPSETFDVLVEKVDTPLAKQLNNKTVLIFGDSVSEFDAQNAGVSQRDSMRWSDWMRCFKPGVTTINVAIGGTRYAQRKPSLSLTPSLAQAWAAVDIVNLVKAICNGDFDYQDAAVPVLAQPTSQGGAGKDCSAQIARAKAVNLSKVTDVVLLAGTNDWLASDSGIPTYLGTVDDTDVQTTLGALNTIITDLLTAAPHVKLHIVTPTVRYKGSTYTDRYWSDTWHTEEDKTLPDYVEGIMAVAKSRHQRCVDLYNGLGWDKPNFWNYFPSTDGTHPLYGFDRIAELVTKDIFM